ncbi:MAG: hypothetical protein HY303_21875 [Candidatus Wallbacteria bacterium]|nr:hypothetical protein [Candidatus Wallbacteria bacterium]
MNQFVRRSALALTVIAALLSPTAAKAIPPFARKYHTSCATCHTAFPNLNTFGEAFKRHGYRFPGRKDEDMTKEETVPLGADSYKKVYPKAIWPDQISAGAPLGMVLESFANYNNRPGSAKGISLDDVGHGSDILAGGTFDDTYSFFGELGIDSDAVSLERAAVTIANVFGGDSGVYMRIGRFVPDFFEFNNKTRMVGADAGTMLIGTTVGVGDNGFVLQDPGMRGFELSGFLGSDTGVNAGWVQAEASSPTGQVASPGNRKDFYFHIDHKFIGDGEQAYRLDGTQAQASTSGKEGAATSGGLEDTPWGDTQSLTAGAFYFNGGTVLANPADPTFATVPVRLFDDFRIYGGDLAFIDHQWKLNAAVSKQDHDQPDIAAPLVSREAFTWMIEANYAWHPCLFTALRYENFNQDEHAGDPNPTTDVRRFVPSLTYLARANMKFTLQALIEDRPAEANGYKFNNAILGVVLGF